MRSPTLCLLGLLLASACDKPLFNTGPVSVRDPSRHGQARPQPSVTDSAAARPGLPDVFVTALRFPEWADWRDGDLRSPELLLFKNGKKLLSIPSDADADRHRYRAGHLWNDRCDGTETVLYRDGEEYFRFSGEEIFRGFTVQDGKVHTLGQRVGGGFCYRVDGVERFSASVGTVLGAPSDFEWEGGAFSQELYYAYGVPLKTEAGQQWEYKVMQGDRFVKTLPADASLTLFDLRYYNGTLYRSERRSGGQLCLVSDEHYRQLPIESSGEVHVGKLVPAGETMLIKGYSDRVPKHYWVCGPEGMRFSVVTPTDVWPWYSDGIHDVAVSIDLEGFVTDFREDTHPFSGSLRTYRLTGPQCCDLKDGVFAAALSHAAGDEHLLWTDGQKDTVYFNGYFTSLQIQ